jgi:hypothetical protein
MSKVEMQCFLFLILIDENNHTQRYPVLIHEHGSIQEEVRCQSMVLGAKKILQNVNVRRGLTSGTSSTSTKTTNKLRGFSPPANYTDRATAACRRS